ncbi:MAG: lysophospholipid acyltransferase family protein [Candidatus Promineifilaceae bacterium]
MSSAFQRLSNSRFGIGLLIAFARLLPPAAGYALGRRLADRLSARSNDPLIQAVRSNQWVVGGGRLESEELGARVRATFRHAAHCLYDTYHYMGDTAVMRENIDFGPGFDLILERERQRNQGTLVVGIHMSNFDFLGQAAARLGLRALMLAYPDPTGGYRQQNEFRRQAGLDLMPASVASLKRAANLLKEGGVVITGADRPVPGAKHELRFFGQPARLPVHHIFLALKSEAPIMVTAAVMDAHGKYHIQTSSLISMERGAGREAEISHNAERVLSVAEGFIRQAPEQWLMFYPVWPGVETQPAQARSSTYGRYQPT